jgi:hypothetical protein
MKYTETLHNFPLLFKNGRSELLNSWFQLLNEEKDA